MERHLVDSDIEEMACLEMDCDDSNRKWVDSRPHGMPDRRGTKRKDRRVAISSTVNPKDDRRTYSRRVSNRN